MALSVDLEGGRISGAIADLVEAPDDRRRAIGLLTRLRADLGRQVHRQLDAERVRERVSGYRAEVPLRLTTRCAGFEVQLGGRIDALFEEPGRTVIEEVKSVTMSGRELRQADERSVPDYALQARLYALALQRAGGAGGPLAVRLLLVSIVDGARATLPVAFDVAAVEQELDALLRGRIEQARQAALRARRLAALGERLRFPYDAPRPRQQELIDALAAGLVAGRPVLAMAPTGAGKTVAALLAGLRQSLARAVPLLYLTAKNTQQRLVAETFEAIARAAGLEPDALTAITLRAKDGMCPPGTLLCHPTHCPLLEGFGERVRRGGVLERLRAHHRHLTPEHVFAIGEAQHLCPFELQLALAGRCELVICDYNYVYDQGGAAGLLGDEDGLRRPVVVIDEAHNLFDRARGYYSPFIALAAVRELAVRVAAGEFLAPSDATRQLGFDGLIPIHGPRLFEQVGAWCAALASAIEAELARLGEEERPLVEGGAVCEPPLPRFAALAEQATALLVRYVLYKRLHQLVRLADPLVELLRGALDLHALLASGERELVPFVDTRRPGLGVLCVNPARRLAALHRRLGGVVALSATLTPLRYWADVLGLAPLDARLLELPSPFPAEHRKVLILPQVATTLRQRDQHYERIAALIAAVIAVRPGRYIAYFPSFAFFGRVRAHLRLPPAQVLVQLPELAPATRQRLLDDFVGHSPRLLLAVLGGVFAEGIDLPGEALIGALIVGPGLPAVSFERCQMQAYFDETHEAGFAYAMLFPGMQRVIQAAGRVIRTPQDYGLIALLDQRFAQPPYSDCLPADWYRWDVRELVRQDPLAELQRFWAQADAGRHDALRGGATGVLAGGAGVSDA